MRDRGSAGRRVAAAFILLAIGFILLVPDPHDHGDAGSLGGLFRLLLPGSAANADPQQTQSAPRPGPQGFCPVHFWQQVAATGLLLALLLRVFFSFEFRVLPFLTLSNVRDLGSVQSRAPPVLL